MRVNHTLEPVYDKNSKVLILGSMPSVKSREIGFYYGHPQNRFWKTLAKVYQEEIGLSKEERKDFLIQHHIALFDVLKSCEISGSSDSSIADPIPNDLSVILNTANIQAIFTTGKKAYQLYQKYCYPKTRRKAICLPSTSPANCPKGIEENLFETYGQIKLFTDN